MNPTAGVATRLSLGIAICLSAVVFRQWAALSILGLLLALSFVPLKTHLDRIGQIIVFMACLVLAWVLTSVIGPKPEHPISPGFALVRSTIAVFALLVGVSQLFLSNPWQGPMGCLGAGLVAVLFLGGGKSGPIYPVLAALYILSALFSISLADSGRPSFRVLDSRMRFFYGAFIFAVAGIAVALSLSLPRAHRWVANRIEMSFAEQRSGFSPYLELGSFTDIVQSDTVVLRIFGPKPDYLRGIVYSRYLQGKWLALPGHVTESKDIGPLVAERADYVRIRKVDGDTEHYFLPLEARNIQVKGGRVRVNSTGILSPLQDAEARLVQFEPGERKAFPISSPSSQDLEVPAGLATALKKIAASWTRGVAEREDELQSIADTLRKNYAYSLKSSRNSKLDPILDFLTHNRVGHCEYFASAMALLARALRIPARVVAGYRVDEYNPFGDYHIVRDRDAHAWVEAWVPEKGWQTFDPTPTAGGLDNMKTETGVFWGIVDAVQASLSRFGDVLERITFFQISMGVAALLACWMALRIVRKIRLAKISKLDRTISYSDPLPEISRLFLVLKGRGESIGENETVEHFARRVAESKTLGGSGPHVEDILMRYCSWRYGKIGSEKEITALIAGWIDQN